MNIKIISGDLSKWHRNKVENVFYYLREYIGYYTQNIDRNISMIHNFNECSGRNEKFNIRNWSKSEQHWMMADEVLWDQHL